MDDYLSGLEYVSAEGLLVSTMAGDLPMNMSEKTVAELHALAHQLRGDKDSCDILDRKRSIKVASGYNLRAFLDYEKTGDIVTHLMTASVGTLGVFTALKFRVVGLVEGKATAALYFRSLSQAAEAVQHIKELGAVAIEMMDEQSIEIVRRQYPEMPIPPSPCNLLIVEFDGEGRLDALEGLLSLLKKKGYSLSGPPIVETGSPEEQEKLWQVRKAMVPILSTYDAGVRPEAFVEDVAVDTHVLPDLIADLKPIFQRHDLVTGIYGHVGDGNLHIRPLLDLNSDSHRAILEDLSREVYETVFRYGGTATAEHGTGRNRAPFLKQEWGETIHGYMRRVKEIFDPEDILNPGMVFGIQSIMDNLKYPSVFAGPHDLSCVDCGYCKSVCPVTEVLGGEEGSRSWIHSARYLHRPDLDSETVSEIQEDMSLCLGCGRCQVRCPSQASVSMLLRDERRLDPARYSRTGPVMKAMTYRYGSFRGLCRLAARLSPIWQGRAVSPIIHRLSGLESGSLGPLRRTDALRQARKMAGAVASPGMTVGFFIGCGHTLLDDGVVEAVTSLFPRLGIRVVIPDQVCCGLPMDHYGYREEALHLVRENLSAFTAEKMDAVVTPCSTCLHMLKDYSDYFPDDDPLKEAAGIFSRKVRDISEILLDDIGLERVFPGGPVSRKVAYHIPCHMTLAGSADRVRELLKGAVGEPIILPEGCCGGAGAYSFLKEEMSRKIFEARISPLVSSGAEEVYTSCPGCQHQFSSNLSRNGVEVGSRHLALLLDDIAAR
jgi:Fe-S oxidoreductase/FAD/FMN-containing dehydrogenase